MRRQSVIALGAAVLLGLFAVFLANTFLSANEQKAAVAPRGMAKVAVAAVPLNYGVEITSDKIRLADYPAASIPPGSFSSVAQLLAGGKRRVALREISVNEPILTGKISGAGQGASIAALLPDGKRAAAVSINEVSGVAGFIRPNDSVDVFITRQVASGDREVQLTDVLLQNIRVIATDQDSKSADGKPAVAKTATLEVNPLEAQKLALAQQVGQLSLVLRKPGEDQNNPMVETVSLGDLRYSLYGGPAVQRASAPARIVRRAAPRRTAPPPAPPPAPLKPVTNSVEVVRGTQGNNYEVGAYGS
jgi:pilus assembly protein CpaB